MSWRPFLLFFLAGVLILTCAAILEPAPGYMDADYYYAGAKLMAAGQGQAEPYIWNFLADPARLPAPSFAYWMPLTSLFAAVGLRLFPNLGWWGARVPLILVAALISPGTALLSWRLTRDAKYAALAGVLALFSGFYMAYLPTSDVFALEMVLGGLFFLLAFDQNLVKVAFLRYILLGALAGLLHLARADGILWAGGAVLAALIATRRSGHLKTWWPVVMKNTLPFLAILLGYSLVMTPWFGRNLAVWGSLFPPGGSRTLWLSEYEQTMIFPAAFLAPQNLLAAGWSTLLRARISAASVVLQSALAVQGQVVLFPFILVGLWKLRHSPETRLGVTIWMVMAAIMVLVFPFASMNGSYFHSAAALQPLLWSAAPLGLDHLSLKYASWRRLSDPGRMVRFISIVIVAVCVLLTGLLYFQRVIGRDLAKPGWGGSDRHYRAVESELSRLGAEPGDPVLVNNPPGFWLASGRPAVVIPYGGTDMLLAVAGRYHIRYLVLEQTNPWQLADLYHDRVVPPVLEYLSSVGTTRLYRIKPGE